MFVYGDGVGGRGVRLDFAWEGGDVLLRTLLLSHGTYKYYDYGTESDGLAHGHGNGNGIGIGNGIGWDA